MVGALNNMYLILVFMSVPGGNKFISIIADKQTNKHTRTPTNAKISKQAVGKQIFRSSSKCEEGPGTCINDERDVIGPKAFSKESIVQICSSKR